jgi:hypothetical protein
MLTCKQVSNTLSEEDYEKLSPLRKCLLKLHVKLCIFCGTFNRQVMDNQDMCRHFMAHEESSPNQAALDEDKKDELKALLAAHSTGVKED